MATLFRITFPKRLPNKTLADRCAEIIGSWFFIGGQAFILSLWIIFNTWAPAESKWDKPPYVLLNLMLSFQAAFTGPVLLMAANRQSEVDRKRDIDHYLIDVYGKEVLESMAAQIDSLHKHLECDDEECHW
jgi:uncharacterized membrane protein